MILSAGKGKLKSEFIRLIGLILGSRYENTSAPFDLDEYDVVWKKPKYAPWGFDEYKDFVVSAFQSYYTLSGLTELQVGNDHNSSCKLPPFWGDDGVAVNQTANGCRASEFDQYGDMEAFGVHPDWQRQLAKFASVQDRLREWNPTVMAKLKNFACMSLKALDFDAIRIDKSTQVTLDAIAEWASSARACADALGKKNFYITGEVTGGDAFGSLYV